MYAIGRPTGSNLQQEVWPPGSADTLCPRRTLMAQVQHWAKMAQTDHVTLRPRPLTLEVMAPVTDASRRPATVHQVWSSYALPFERYGGRCVSALMGLVTLAFDLLTLKPVRESHQRWGTLIQNLGTLGLRVLQLFAMFATDGRADKSNA